MPKFLGTKGNTKGNTAPMRAFCITVVLDPFSLLKNQLLGPVSLLGNGAVGN
jgi:hypothetical protein